MPVELRKRKSPESAPAPPVASKKKSKAAVVVEKAAAKIKEVVAPKEKAPAKTNGAASAASSKAATKSAVAAPPPEVGSIIEAVELEGFGGEIETNDGEKTTLKKLLDASKSGVVLFTYPKASTPGCTTQACLFRDSYTPLTSTGLSIYGLSRDSPKANTTFKTKQNLPYPLLCDTSSTLISAIGFKKAPSSTTRGVFVISKEGKVLARTAGGPAPTVEVVKKLVAAENPGLGGTSVEDVEKALVAADVADTAEKIDGEVNEGDKMDVDEDQEKAEVAAEVADTAEALGEK